MSDEPQNMLSRIVHDATASIAAHFDHAAPTPTAKPIVAPSQIIDVSQPHPLITAPTYSPAFVVAAARTYKLERGFVDDPKDPGGRTNGGISQKTYPNLDIASLTRDQIVALYWRDFWTPLRADDMPPAIAYQAFDFAINSGPARAVELLQTVLGITADGSWGPATKAAAAQRDVYALAMLYLAERLEFLRGLPGWAHDGGGWSARIVTNLRYAVLDTSTTRSPL